MTGNPRPTWPQSVTTTIAMTTPHFPIPARIPARLLAALVALLLVPLVARAQTSVTVRAAIEPERAYVGDPVTLVITVQGGDNVDIKPVELPADLDAVPGGRSQGSFSSREVVNGRVVVRQTNSIQQTYAVRASRPGEHLIPPQIVTVDGADYLTNELRLIAIEPALSPDDTLEVVLEAAEVFVGQSVPFTLVWTASRSAGMESPIDFSGSTLPSGLEAVMPPSRGRLRATNGSTEFNVFGVDTPARILQDPDKPGAIRITVEGIFTPSSPGTYTIDDIELTYNRNLGAAGRARLLVRALPAALTARPLPTEGKPANFAGLMGVYDIRAEAAPTTVNVGDPIELAVTILGKEPMRGLTNAPDLAQQPEFAGAFKLSPEGWRYDPSGGTGRRRFTTTIRAARDDLDAIPPIELPFFDPQTRTYRTAKSAPIPIDVRATREVTAADALVAPAAETNADANPLAIPAAAERLTNARPGLWAVQTGPAVLAHQRFDALAALRAPAFLAAAASPVVIYAGVAITLARRRAHDPTLARRRAALARATATLRRRGPAPAIRQYLADIFDRPAEALTPADCEALLGHTPTTDTQPLAELLARAEADRYGGPIHAPATIARPQDDAAATLDLLRRVDKHLRTAR